MDEKGLYVKYEVRKKETGELVEYCFVLRPERDIAAVKALETYAEETQNKQLSQEITVLLEYGIKGDKELYPNGGNCAYCDEFTDKLRPSPFMADTGADMCKYCWDSTKEEYATSNGEYIPNFDDYPHWKSEVDE
jgi:hypothetical protein